MLCVLRDVLGMAARSSAAAWRSAAPALCVPTARPSVPARRAHRQLRHQDDRDDRRDRSNRRSAPAWHRSNEASRRLATIPGVSSLTASAIVATVANATEFKSARHFAAFLGLTPKQCSTGGRQRLGRISKQGDVYIRRLLILGGTSLEARPAWLAEAPADLPYLKALLAPTLRGYGLLAGVRALATSNCERSGQSFAPPRPYTELDVRADRIITAGTTELAGAGVPSCRAGARTRREAAFRDPGNARRWQDAIG